MWSSLGVASAFAVLLLIWWGVTDQNDKNFNYNKAIAPVGLVCITVVFIVLLFLTHR